MGSSHAFIAILPNIDLYAYTIRYKPGIKNTLFFSKISKKFQNSEKFPYLGKHKNMFFFPSRISFNIKLHTYTVRYRPNIKNT
jgi:hypothetical protein